MVYYRDCLALVWGLFACKILTLWIWTRTSQPGGLLALLKGQLPALSPLGRRGAGSVLVGLGLLSLPAVTLFLDVGSDHGIWVQRQGSIVAAGGRGFGEWAAGV